MYEDGAVFPRPGSAEVPHVQHMGRTMSVSWAFTSPHPDAKQKKAKCRTPKKKKAKMQAKCNTAEERMRTEFKNRITEQTRADEGSGARRRVSAGR